MRRALKDLWSAEEGDDEKSFLVTPRLLLCRTILFGIFIAACVAAVITVLVIGINIPSVIHVTDSIETINIEGCFVSMNPKAKRGNEYVYVTYPSATIMDLKGTSNGLCSAIILIPSTRTTSLEIIASEATVELLYYAATTFPFEMKVTGQNTLAGAVRLSVGGAKFSSLSVSLATGIVVLDTNAALPSTITCDVGFGAVALPFKQIPAAYGTSPTPVQKITVDANVTDGGYCLTSDAASAAADMSYTVTTNVASEWSNFTYTIIKGTMFNSAATAATSSIQINASSLYITRDIYEDHEYGTLMNETQRLRPLVETTLAGSSDFSANSVNKQYVQVIEIVAPYAGAIFLNSNTRFAIEFGVEILSLLSGFQLTPTYRKMNTALSHYTCNKSTHIGALSTAILLNPFDATTVGATQVDISTSRFIPTSALRNIFISITNLTHKSSVFTAFSTVKWDLQNVPNIVGKYMTFLFDGDSYKLVEVNRTSAQWVLLIFTIVLGVYVATVALIVAIIYRTELIRVLYLQEARAFVRQVQNDIGNCPYFLYTSLYSLHSMMALNVIRGSMYLVRTAIPSLPLETYIAWMLRHASSEEDPEARMISLDQLNEKYALMWASRYAYRIDFARSTVRQILRDNDYSIKTQEFDIITNISPAHINTEHGGDFAFEDLYRTTPNEYDESPAFSIANTLYLERPVTKPNEKSVLQEAQARSLPIKRAEVEVLTNAKWSPAAFVEKITEAQASRAEASFASFPAYMELRPLTEFPEFPVAAAEEDAGLVSNATSNVKAYWANRDEIKGFVLHRLEIIGIGLAQSFAHVGIIVWPFVLVYAMVDLFVKDSTKYSMSSRHFAFVELIFGWVQVTADWLSLQNMATFIIIGFCGLAFFEPLVIIFFRVVFPTEVGLTEKILRYPVTAITSIVYLLGVLFAVAYFVVVLLWWIIGAIAAPDVMLAFASAALTLFGVLMASYKNLSQSKSTIVERVKERLLEALLEMLKKSGANFTDAECGDDGLGVGNSDGMITLGLLADVAGEKPEAIEKLGTILQVPPPFLNSVLAIQSRDPAKLRKASDQMLELCDVPLRFRGIMQQIVLRAMGISVPLSQLTHAIYDLAPTDGEVNVQRTLRSADHVITPCLEAMLSDDPNDMSRVWDALLAAGTSFVVDKSSNKITREMCQSATEAITSVVRNRRSITFPTIDTKAVSNTISNTVSKHANKDFILGGVLKLMEEVTPLIVADASYDIERLWMMLMEGIKFALGRDDNQFCLHLLNALDSLVEGLDESISDPNMLRIWKLVCQLDPIAKQYITSFLRDEFEELSDSGDDEDVEDEEGEDEEDYDDYYYDDEYDDDDYWGDEEEAEEGEEHGDGDGDDGENAGAGDDGADHDGDGDDIQVHDVDGEEAGDADGDGQPHSPAPHTVAEDGDNNPASSTGEANANTTTAAGGNNTNAPTSSSAAKYAVDVGGTADGDAATNASAVTSSSVGKTAEQKEQERQAKIAERREKRRLEKEKLDRAKKETKQELSFISEIGGVIGGFIELHASPAAVSSLRNMYLAIFSSKTETCVEIIKSLGYSSSSDKKLLDPHKIVRDAYHVVDAFVTSHFEEEEYNEKQKLKEEVDKAYEMPKDRQQQLKEYNCLSIWLGYQWISMLRLEFANIFPAEASYDKKFMDRATQSSLKSLTGIPFQAMQVFEYFVKVASHFKSIIDGFKLVEISGFHCLEIIRNGIPMGKRVVPMINASPRGILKNHLNKVNCSKLGPLSTKPLFDFIVDKAPPALASALTALGMSEDKANWIQKNGQNFVGMLFRILRFSMPDIVPQLKALESHTPADKCVAATSSRITKMVLGMVMSRADSARSQKEKNLERITKVSKSVLDEAHYATVTGKMDLLGAIAGQEQKDRALQAPESVRMAIKMGHEVLILMLKAQQQAGDGGGGGGGSSGSKGGASAAATGLLGSASSISASDLSNDDIGKLARKLDLTDRQIIPLLRPASLIEHAAPYAAYFFEMTDYRVAFNPKDPRFLAFLKKGLVDATVVDRRYVVPFFNLFGTRIEHNHVVCRVSDNKLMYPVQTFERTRSLQKQALLFCNLVNPHPFCLEAFCYFDLFGAIKHFIDEYLLPFSAATAAAAATPAKAATGAATGAAAAAATAKPSAGGAATSDPSSSSPMSPASAKKKQVNILKTLMDKKWKLLVDMIRTTCPVLGDANFSDTPARTNKFIQDTKSKDDIVYAIKVISREMQAARICEDHIFPKHPSTLEQFMKGFVPTPEFNHFIYITMGIKDFQAKMEDEPSEAQMQRAFRQANPFPLFICWDEFLATTMDDEPVFYSISAATFFVRCHGMEELPPASDDSGGEEADSLSNEMFELGAFCCLLVRRNTVPRQTWRRLINSLSEQMALLASDLLILKSQGTKSDVGVDGFSHLSKALDRLEFPRSGNNIKKTYMDYMGLLHGSVTGYALCEAMGGADVTLYSRSPQGVAFQMEQHQAHLRQGAGVGVGGAAAGRSTTVHPMDSQQQHQRPGTARSRRASVVPSGAAAAAAATTGGGTTGGAAGNQSAGGGGAAPAAASGQQHHHAAGGGGGGRQKVGRHCKVANHTPEEIDQKKLLRWYQLLVNGNVLALGTVASEQLADTVTRSSRTTDMGADFELKFFRAAIFLLYAKDEVRMPGGLPAYDEEEGKKDDDADGEKKQGDGDNPEEDDDKVMEVLGGISNKVASVFSPMLRRLLKAVVHATDHPSRVNMRIVRILDPTLVSLLAHLTNPLKSLLQLVPISSETKNSKAWCAACLAICLIQRDWSTAADCFTKLIELMNGPPALGKVFPLIIRSGADMLAPDGDKLAVAADLIANLIDLIKGSFDDEDKAKYAPPIDLARCIVVRSEPSPELIKNTVLFIVNCPLREYMDEKHADLISNLVDFSADAYEEFTANSTEDNNQALKMIVRLFDLVAPLVLQEEQIEKAEMMKTFLEDQILPIVEKAELAIGTSTDIKLSESIELPVIVRCIEMAAENLPDDVLAKVRYAQRLAKGDFTVIPALTAAIGVKIDDAMMAKIFTVLKMAKAFQDDPSNSLSAAGDYLESAAKDQVAALINQLIEYIFSQFDRSGTGKISFNSFKAIVKRLHFSTPDPELKVLFENADKDKSGFIDREEFKQVVFELADMMQDKVMDTLGLSDQQMTYILVAIFANLVLIGGFILLGVSTFSSGDSFTAVIGGVMPFFMGGLSKGSQSLDELVNAADRAVGSVIQTIKSI